MSTTDCFCGLPLKKHSHCPVCSALCGPGHPDRSRIIPYRGARICQDCLTKWQNAERKEKRTLTYSEFKTGSRKPDQVQTHQLTGKEIKILGLIYRGLSNKQIAWELKISASAVKQYNAKIFLKLQVNSRTEAVYKAIQLNLIELSLQG